MEVRLFPEGTVPEWTTPEWYAGRDAAPHVDEPGHRPRLELAASMVRDLCAERDWCTVSDLGAGDGGLLSLLAGSGLTCWGYDLQPSNVAGAAVRGVDVTLRDVLTETYAPGEVVVATEMIEHLLDPHAFVRGLNDGYAPLAVVASSPWTETAESHYEYHAWAWDVAGYRAMFEAVGWVVVRHQQVGMFQVLAAVRP